MSQGPTDRVLALERRRHLYALIRDHPGLHVRELERRTGTPFSTLRHHLDALVRHGLVETQHDGQATRYFARSRGAGSAAMLALRQEPLRRLLVLMLHAGGETSYRTLLALSGLAPSTLSTQLGDLVRRGLLRRYATGRESHYVVADPDAVLCELVRHQESFLDPYVDALVAAMEESMPACPVGDPTPRERRRSAHDSPRLK